MTPRRSPARPRSQVGLPDDDPRLQRVRELFKVELGDTTPFQLRFTQGRNTYLRTLRAGEGKIYELDVRFLDAPDLVIRAAIHFAGRATPTLSRLLGDYMRETLAHSPPPEMGDVSQASLPPFFPGDSSSATQGTPPDPSGSPAPTLRRLPQRPPPPIHAQGRVYDLEAMYQRFNAEFFEGALDLRIAWSMDRPTRGKQTVRLGSWSPHTRTVWIHPVLDRSAVPDFFVEFIVFHELCHAKVGVERHGRRRLVHGPAFHREWRRYPHFEKAEKWEKEHLHRILRNARPLDRWVLD